MRGFPRKSMLDEIFTLLVDVHCVCNLEKRGLFKRMMSLLHSFLQRTTKPGIRTWHVWLPTKVYDEQNFYYPC